MLRIKREREGRAGAREDEGELIFDRLRSLRAANRCAVCAPKIQKFSPGENHVIDPQSSNIRHGTVGHLDTPPRTHRLAVMALDTQP